MANTKNITDKKRLKALQKAAAPVFIWEPSSDRVRWANAAAAAVLGMSDQAELASTQFDSAMPAARELKALPNGPAGDRKQRRLLTFWTDQGPLQFDCECEHTSLDGIDDLILLTIGVPSEFGKEKPRVISNHPSQTNRQGNSGARDTDFAANSKCLQRYEEPPQSAMGEQQTMAEIARQIHERTIAKQSKRPARLRVPAPIKTLDVTHTSEGPSKRPPTRSVASLANVVRARKPQIEKRNPLLPEDKSTLRQTTGLAVCMGDQIVHASGEWLRVFDYDSLDELTTKHSLKTILPEARARLLKPASERPGKVAIRTMQATMRSGDKRAVKIGAKVLEHFSDETQYTLLMLNDTETTSNGPDHTGSSTDLLARVSHELRTPLTAIIGFADMMKHEQFGPIGNERYEGYVSDMLASAHHALTLINDLTDFSKIEIGQLTLKREEIDLGHAAANALNTLSPFALKSQVRLINAMPVKLPVILADARSVKQILLNLLTNAIKFTDAGGTVAVTSETQNERGLIIRITDTGVGMSEEQLQRALEPLYQLDVRQHAQSGTGIGLPLSKALAEANGAEFRISSASELGTTVELAFPRLR